MKILAPDKALTGLTPDAFKDWRRKKRAPAYPGFEGFLENPEETDQIVRGTNMDAAAIAIVTEFFRRMNTNDFQSAGLMLSDDYILEWPQ